jgi:demethylmenaquinone methyltransferase/2-methoxy-6-polyprenyl-1,4-benzoquinol methylase
MKIADPVNSTVYRGPDPDAVQRMFAGIAPRYDFLNHFLSVSVDKRWRKAAVAKVQELLTTRANPICVDLCGGTGDLALELQSRLHTPVLVSDFCHPMLIRATEKFTRLGIGSVMRLVEADALNLPLPDQAFDALTIGFGLRNLEDPIRGLREMFRILKPGGVLVILEFSKPVIPVLREAFGFYFRNILPRLGAFVSGDGGAYEYLPNSVGKFPPQPELARMIRSVGFRDVDYKNLTGGIAALHWGVR